MSSDKKKIPPKPEKMFKSSVKDKKLFKNDSIADRVNLTEWTLPNDKGFVSFLKSFDIVQLKVKIESFWCLLSCFQEFS